MGEFQTRLTDRLRTFLSDERNPGAARALRRITSQGWRSCLFGGLVRDALLAPTEVRDIDVVVEGVSLNELRKAFHDVIIRQTRFGGLTLRLEDWHVDVWPLESTWGWRLLGGELSGFSGLPRTTFFSLEAVAVELCEHSGQPLAVHQHRFEESIQKRTVFLNLPDNPYPELCVVRAFVLARKLDYALAEDLVRHLASWTRTTTRHGIECAMIDHYRQPLFSREELARLVRQLQVHAESGTRESLRLCFDPHPNQRRAATHLA